MNTTATSEAQKRRKAWLLQCIGKTSISEFARRIDIQRSTVNAWLSRNNIPAEGVIRVALWLDLDPIEALVDTYYLPWRWYPKEVPDLKRARTEDLVEELQGRLPQELGDTVATIVNSYIAPLE